MSKKNHVLMLQKKHKKMGTTIGNYLFESFISKNHFNVI